MTGYADARQAHLRRLHRIEGQARGLRRPPGTAPDEREIIMTATYTVKGMTCGHCVSSVTEEVGVVPGVTGVEVDLATGLVTVEGAATLDDTAITAAIEEAGYEVVSPS